MNGIKNLLFAFFFSMFFGAWGVDNVVLTERAKRLFTDRLQIENLYNDAFSLILSLSSNDVVYIIFEEFIEKLYKPKGYIKVTKKGKNPKINVDYLNDVPAEDKYNICLQYSLREFSYVVQGNSKKNSLYLRIIYCIKQT